MPLIPLGRPGQPKGWTPTKPARPRGWRSRFSPNSEAEGNRSAVAPVGQAFQPAGASDFPVRCFEERATGKSPALAGWKACPTVMAARQLRSLGLAGPAGQGESGASPYYGFVEREHRKPVGSDRGNQTAEDCFPPVVFSMASRRFSSRNGLLTMKSTPCNGLSSDLSISA